MKLLKNLFILALIVSLAGLMSCGGGEEEFELDKYLDGEAEELVSEDGLIAEEEEKAIKETPARADKVDTVSEIPGGSEDAEEIAALVRKGNYAEAIARGEGSSDYGVKYWVGIANYCKMLMREKFSGSERAGFRDNASQLLKEVGYDAPNDTLKARALLWYAMTIHLNYVNLAQKRQAMGALHRIQTTVLKDTPVYDDAHYYSALIYRQMGWYIQARRHLKILARGGGDDRVFDPEDGIWRSAAEASSHGLEKVRKICYAEGGAPVASEPEPVVESEPEPEPEPVVEPEPVTEPVIDDAVTDDTTVDDSMAPTEETTTEEAPADDFEVEAAPASEEAPAEDNWAEDNSEEL